MTLSELASSFESQLQADPFITIDDSVLGSAGVDELLRAQLGLSSGRLEVTVPSRKVSYPGTGPLVISGNVGFLGLPKSQTVTLTFLEEAGGIVFDLTATLPGSWDFGTSFPDLIGPFEGLLVSGGSGPRAQLVFATFSEQEVAGAPNPFAGVGLNFNGTIGLAGVFKVLVELLSKQAEDEGLPHSPPTEALLQGPIERVPLTAPGEGGKTETITVTNTRLQATLAAGYQPGEGLTIGPVTIKKIYVAIANAYVGESVPGTLGVSSLLSAPEEAPDTTPLDGLHRAQETSLAFGGTTEVFTRPVDMEVDLTAVPVDSGSQLSSLELSFFSPEPSQTIVSLKDLVGLLGEGWEEAVPQDFRGAFSFGLHEAGVLFALANSTPTLRLVHASMGLSSPWKVYETASQTTFVLDPLDMHFSWLYPGGQKASTAAGSVDGTLTIAGPHLRQPFAFSASLGFASGGLWTVTGAYLGTVGFSLDDLNAGFFANEPVPEPHGDFFATVTFANPGFLVEYRASQENMGTQGGLERLALETGLDVELDLLGEKVLLLQSGELHVAYQPAPQLTGGSTSASLLGTVFIVGIGFSISADVSAAGLHFHGALLTQTPIDLMKFAGQLLPGSLRPPGADSLEITKLSVDADTGAKTYDVAGTLASRWLLPIGDGGTFLTAEVSAEVKSWQEGGALLLDPAERRHREAAHGHGTELVQLGGMELGGLPTGMEIGASRAYEVALAGKFTIAGMTIAFTYKFEKGKSVLTGTWKEGGGQKFDYEEVATSLNIDPVGLALPSSQSLPNLGLAEVDLLLEMGGGTDLFALSGTSGSGDEGSFLARKAESWGFAVGVKITKSGWVVTHIPGLEDFLADFDFSEAAVLVSSFSDPAFQLPVQLPALLPKGATGIKKGFNFYAEFDLAGNKNSDIEAARGLLKTSASTAVVVAYIAERTSGLEAGFSLDLKVHRQLENFAFEEADIGFSVNGDSFAVWVGLLLSAPVHGTTLYFGGQIEVRNEGFDAILWLDTSRFKGGVWPNAFGVDGLDVGSAALLLGISDVDALPSFGVYGSLSYKSFEGTLVAVLDSETDDPTKNQSMFVASVSDFSLGELAELLPDGSVTDGIHSVLEQFSVSGTRLFTASISKADAETLNQELQVPESLMGTFEKEGFKLPSSGSKQTAQERARRARAAAETPGTNPTPFVGVTVAPEETDEDGHGKPGNLTWFITDRTRLWTYTVTATGSGDAYTVEVKLDAQLYVVPNQIELPHFPPLQPGYHANGKLTVFGYSVWFWASARMSLPGGQTSLPGVELTAFFDPIEFAGLVAITRGSAWENDPWWKQRMEAARQRSLRPNKELGEGPAFSVSTFEDKAAPDGLKEPHALIAAEVKLFKTGSGSWLATASALIAILADGSFVFDLEFELGPATFALDAHFDEKAEEFSGLATGRVSLGNVDLPGVPEILPSGTKLLEVDLGLEVEAGNGKDKLSLEVGFKVFGIGFSFTIPIEVPFLEDIVGGVKEFMEDAANVGTVFADILGELHFPKWLASALAGFFKDESAEFFARAMKAFGQAAEAAAALLQALEFDLELAKAAIKVFEGDPKELEELVERVYGLQLKSLALAQRVGPPAGTQLTNYDAVEKWATETMVPAIEASEWDSIYAPQGQWLAALELGFLKVLDIGVAFYDPDLASLKLALELTGTPIKFSTEITYRRVSEGLGVYTTEIQPPSDWGQQSFGPVKFSLPPLAISIYTNGDFLVDLGFPFNEDWGDSVQVSVPELSGAGGFYFGALPAVVDQLLPEPKGCNPIIEAGVALKLAYHRSLDIGIFSGGVDASFLGVVQGAVGFDQGHGGNFLGTPSQIALRGRLALAASIYGEVNFGIVQAEANLSVNLGLDVGLVTHQPLDLTFEAHIYVHVEIRINLFITHITIGFHFSATAYVPFSISWGGREIEAPAGPVAFLPAGEVGAMRRAATVRSGRPAASPNPPLPIFFMPEGTIVYEPSGATAQAVAGLAIEYEAGNVDCPFNRLAAAAANWVLASADERYRASGRIDREGLRRVARELRASRRDPGRYRARGGDSDPTAADYVKLTQYLSSAFTVMVTGAPKGEATGVPFPMVPELLLAVEGRASPQGEAWPRDFSQFNPLDAEWQRWVQEYFRQVRVFGGAAKLGEEYENGGLPVCEYLFVDWFQMLHEGAVESLSHWLRRSGAEELTREEVDGKDFGELAGNITRLFRGGVQLPEAANSKATKPIFELSGQQFELLNQEKTPYKLSLSAKPGVTWFTVSGAEATLETDQLETLLTQPAPVGMPHPPTIGPYYKARPRTWTFGTVATLGTGANSYVVASFPPALSAAVGAAGGELAVNLLQQASGPGAPQPVSAPAAQALRVPLRVRRLPGAAEVYEVWGLDQTVLGRLDALAEALAAGQPEARGIVGTLAWGAGGSYATGSAAAASIELLRTNLTTETAPPHAELRERGEPQPAVAANLTEMAPLVEILRWYGRTNAPGYYLAYPGGLPEALFAGKDVAELSLLLAPPSGTATISLAAWADTLLLGPAAPPSSPLIYLAEAEASGPVELTPTVSPGVVPITVERPAAKVEEPLASLYSLVTFALAETEGFEASVTAVPTGPIETREGEWGWSLFPPVAKLVKGSPESPYAAIGQDVSLDFFVRDVYGNDLQPLDANLLFPYSYTDRLVPVSSWPGVSLSFDFAVEHEGAVLIELSADAEVLTREKGPDAQRLMQTVVDQLGGPAVGLSVATDLDPTGGAYSVGGPNAPYEAGSPTVAEFAAGVLSYLKGGGEPPQACKVVLTPAAPLTTQQPTRIAASLTIERSEFVEPEVAASVPEASSVTSAATPAPERSEADLATSFEAAFDGYVLAAVAGKGSAHVFYAVSRKLLEVSIAGGDAEPTYFSPLPISATLASGSVEVPVYAPGQTPPSSSPFTYTDADLDREMATLFAAVDALLAPSPAAAARAAAPADFEALVRARAALAQQYSQHQLHRLFEEQTPPSGEDPNLQLAQSSFSAQLDAALAAAYEIQALLQVGVEWKDPSAGTGVTETVDLFGSVEPAGAGESASPAAHFDRSTAKVRLQPGESSATGRLTFASTLGAGDLPAASEPYVSLPLQYHVTDLVLGDTSGSQQLGTEATWLRLVEPVTVPIGEGGAATEVPAPLRQFPVPPTVVGQEWSPRVPLEGGDEPVSGFAELREWGYRYEYAYAGVLPEAEHPVPSGSVRTIVSYNDPVSVRLRGQADEDAGLALQDALALFAAGYAQVAADLAVLSTLPVARAADAVEYFVGLIEGVLGAAWPPPGQEPVSGANEDAFQVDYVDHPPPGHEGAGAVLRLRSGSADAIDRATITPCGPGGPLPESKLHRYYEQGATEKFVVYDPADAKPGPGSEGWLSFALEVDGLDVTTRQSAWASVQALRNVHLLPSLTTNPGYVYRSLPVKAAKRITPALARPDRILSVPSITGHATGSVQDYLGWVLTDLLTPPLGPGPAAPPSFPVRVGVDLEVALNELIDSEGKVEEIIGALTPIGLTPTLLLVTPGQGVEVGEGEEGSYAIEAVAAAVAGVVEAYLAEGVEEHGVSLAISTTVFADDPVSHASVLSLGRLQLPLSDLVSGAVANLA